MLELHVPRLKPASCDSWEIRDSLAAADNETGRITLDFPEPYLIVGMYPSVISTTDEEGFKDPTTDDILVLLDLNNQRRFTAANQIGGQTSAAARQQEFCTLSVLNTMYRDLQIDLNTSKPVIGITFRWKISDSAVRELLYNDAIVSLAFFCTRKGNG